ncbi:WcbI family polysaccharide biosynthesis putative acetyltransferase [Asticcacaulis sp. BYS171W]|uniref:WcbI family polysaccharide biosynthesis putative acetyltransferase n=1 Tax=Asticcacaulis aquaticus TaxID=2984212 RepID=A0ABT5HRP0_9CAUL|nr:WcbI family polysaccharide biosynthesis putative acetyltransferase [Asticcacaulis aquaticus]
MIGSQDRSLIVRAARKASRLLSSLTPSAGSPRIALVGNCQAQALIPMLKAMVPSAHILGAVSVASFPRNTYANHARLIDTADIVLSLTIHDQYPVEWLRTTNLQTLCGDRLHLIPNMYFLGYTPDMVYLHAAGSRHVVQGPMTDYHLASVIHAYQQGWSPDRAVALFSDDTFFERNYAGAAEQSLAEMVRREAHLEVRMADYIAEHYKSRRLFHTLNHPTAHLLGVLAHRILSHLGIDHYDISQVTQEDYLSDIVKAPHPAVHRMLGLNFDNPSVDRAHVLKPDHTPDLYSLRYYTPQELVEAYYAVYDRHREFIMAYQTHISA